MRTLSGTRSSAALGGASDALTNSEIAKLNHRKNIVSISVPIGHKDCK
jgi:hypothetical protein